MQKERKDDKKRPQLAVDILSLYPRYFESPLSEGLLKRALDKKLLSINLVDIREHAEDKRQVDDRPFGGGPGMVMKPEPVARAIDSVKSPESSVLYLSPQGKRLSPSLCKQLATIPHLILLCGHYEGIDQRVVNKRVDMEVSIGDYVLTNGCLASLVLLDSIARFVPGVLGNAHTPYQDSFEKELFDCPHYTQPWEFEGERVPQVLREGNHRKTDNWRRQQALDKTKACRPDLYLRYAASPLTNAEGFTLFLEVQNLKETVRFYTRVLGFKIQEQTEEKAHLKGHNIALHVVYNQRPQQNTSGLYSLCVPQENYTRLQSQTKLEGGRTLHIKDPEGNQWLIHAPSLKPLG